MLGSWVMLAAASSLSFACAVTSTKVSFGQTNVLNFDHIYQIDLERNVWCRTPCNYVTKVHSADAEWITLLSETSGNEQHRTTTLLRINRKTGEHQDVWESFMNYTGNSPQHGMIKAPGTCKEVPAIAFPATVLQDRGSRELLGLPPLPQQPSGW